MKATKEMSISIYYHISELDCFLNSCNKCSCFFYIIRPSPNIRGPSRQPPQKVAQNGKPGRAGPAPGRAGPSPVGRGRGGAARDPSAGKVKKGEPVSSSHI